MEGPGCLEGACGGSMRVLLGFRGGSEMALAGSESAPALENRWKAVPGQELQVALAGNSSGSKKSKLMNRLCVPISWQFILLETVYGCAYPAPGAMQVLVSERPQNIVTASRKALGRNVQHMTKTALLGAGRGGLKAQK